VLFPAEKRTVKESEKYYNQFIGNFQNSWGYCENNSLRISLLLIQKFLDSPTQGDKMLKLKLGTRKLISYSICFIMLLATSSAALAASGDLANVQVSKVSGTVTVTNEYGTVVYKGSDDADAIEAAMKAIDSGIIYFGKGEYNIDRTLRLKSDITFIGDDGVIFKCSKSPGFTTGTGGYSSSTIPVASDANSGTTQIKLSSVSGLNVGNYIKISDDFTVSYEGNYYKNGELAKIVAISGSTITIDKPLYDSYTLSRNARVREISMLENIRFENIKFVGYGMDTSSTAIYLYATKNVTFSNCGIEDFGTRAISFFDCLDCTVENSIFKRVFRDGTGYGIAITNACDNIVIKNNSFLEKGRHYIAVVSSSGGVTTDGFTRHVDVLDNIFRDCADEAVNSHPTSAPIFRVIGNEIYDSRKGVELARTDSIIKDNKFYRCGNAVVTLSTGDHVIEGNYFNGNRISIIPHSTSNIIRNNVFDNGGYIMPELNAVIESNTFRNYSGYIIYASGSSSSYLQNIEISNNLCEDPLTLAMKLSYAKNVKLSNNDLRGYPEFRACDNVEIDGNRINSPASSGVRVIDAKGPCTITDNELKADSVGISLENTGTSLINEKVLIARNAVDAPKAYSNDDYSNVIVEGGTPETGDSTPGASDDTPTTLVGVQDSRLREGSPDTVYNDVAYLDLGGRDEVGAYRDLVIFDLSEYEDAELIENATLSLFWYYPEGAERSEDTIVEIYRPEAWNPEYATWNSRDLNTPWANAGGDWYDRNNASQGSTPYATITIKGSDVPDSSYHELDVTELVKEYVGGEYENTGFLIKARTESGNYVAFYSSDCGITESIPKLDVELKQESGDTPGSGDTPDEALVLSNLQDNRLREGSPDTVYNDVRYIDLGGRDGVGGYRDLVMFDLSELDNAEMIGNATLSLFWYYPEGTARPEDTIVEIYRPDAWNPDYATWNSRDLNTPWANAGGDWHDLNGVSQGSTPYATISIKGSDVPDNSYHEIDVTELVKEYVSGEYENTGFLIKARTESGNYMAFYSSDCGITGCTPKLDVELKPAPVAHVLSNLQDNRLREGSPDAVFNDVRYIDLGGRDGVGGYRDLVLFDLSEFDNAESIECADLSLFWYYPAGIERPEDTIVEIYRPESWNPDYATWNSRDLNTPWVHPGGDWFDLNNVAQGSTPYATLTIKGSDVPDNNYHKLDVTELVKEYVSGEYENTGFLVKARTESDNYIAFCSSEYASENQRPVLTVSEKA